MKRMLLLTTLLISFLCQAQDYDFLQKLKEPVTADAAKSLAGTLAGKSSGGYHFYKDKKYDDYGIYLVVFAPDGVTDAQIEAQKHNDNCFVVYFKKFNENYIFDKVVVNYNDIYPVWQNLFNAETQPDKKNSRIANPDKGVYYSLNQDNPNWVIRR